MEMIPKKLNIKRKWFHDRIGKRVYRKPNGCNCKSCLEVAHKGLVITDRQHAETLCCYSVETGVEYFDEPVTPN